LIVGAEAQAGFMPWNDWAALEPDGPAPSPEDYERATRHRGYAVIFGDGAGALLLERCEDGPGLLSLDVHTDGRYLEQLYIPAGYRRRPYISSGTIQREEHLPLMEGREVFKHAVTKIPTSIRKACADAGVTLEQVDWFIAHQANDRINDSIRERLGVPAEKVPSNIARYGNTSTATIPILMDEMRRDGRLRSGQIVCVLALGAGLHWGARCCASRAARARRRRLRHSPGDRRPRRGALEPRDGGELEREAGNQLLGGRAIEGGDGDGAGLARQGDAGRQREPVDLVVDDQPR
jgi:3-oxoacyl-[acyl-carrier-protein] synthase-3